jgi:hypothetical protein
MSNLPVISTDNSHLLSFVGATYSQYPFPYMFIDALGPKSSKWAYESEKKPAPLHDITT